MNETARRGRAACMVFLAAAAWFALALQFYLVISRALASGRPILAAAVEYFSFFTILTNLLVALSLSVPLLAPRSRVGRFLVAPAVQSGVAAAIVLVGLAYELLLRHLWSPRGAQLLADMLLHDAVPMLYALYWFIFVPKGALRVGHVAYWLAYPGVYFVYVMIRGAWSGAYPYPFLDAGALGSLRLLINIALLLAGFLCIALTLVIIDRALTRRAI